MKNYTIKQLNKGEETALPCSGIPRPVEGMTERENHYSALSRVIIISGETPLTDAEITGESMMRNGIFIQLLSAFSQVTYKLQRKTLRFMWGSPQAPRKERPK